MAVTIVQNPQSYTPSDSPIYWKFSSDETAQPNFSFIVKVYVNDIQVSERQVLPTLETAAYYDAVNEGRNFTFVPTPQTGNIFNAADNNAELFIEIYERYGNTPVTQPVFVTSNTVIVWKSKIKNSEFQYYLQSSIEDQFITNYDFERKVRLSEQIRFMVLNKENDFDLTIRTYKNPNVLLDTVVLTRTNDDQFTIINVSPAVIEENTIISMSGVDYYTIQCSNGFTTPLETIQINKACNQTTSKRVHWISQIGSIESFSLDLISRKKNDIESFGFKRKYDPSLTDPNSVGLSVDTSKRRDIKLLCYSNWLNNTEHDFLTEDLYFSPVVFVEENGGFSLTRVKITNTSSETKTIENDEVFNEVIELGLGTETSFLG